MTKKNPHNRVIEKANRNLFQDQIVFIQAIVVKTGRSESEVLREIVDFYISHQKKKELREKKENWSY